MPICELRSGKNCTVWPQDKMVKVEHVKAHRTKKEHKDMLHFDKFVTEGDEKADELAKNRSNLDEGFMAEARAESMQQE